MRRRDRNTRIAALVAAAVAICLSGLYGAVGASAAPAHLLIQGTGSTWAANAVNQWIADVSSSGLQVVFTGGGSAQGRKDFANGTTDFAVSDIGYQGTDPLTGEEDTNCPSGPSSCRAYAYEPIVAGGTSFPYQVKVGGQLVRNLRLSGETLAKIFTAKITNWNDPQITHDNNGRALPSLPIIPVVHSEGSGSTAMFTMFLAKQYPSLWRSFAGGSGFTEYFPKLPSGHGIAQNGSDGVMNFVSSRAANGAIGYDEYSYAIGKGWPVAKVLNEAGYYTLPDQYNVAVALQHAQINMDTNSPDYLLQNLDKVYVATEPQVYPLSSYSYFLIPTAKSDTRMNTARRQTLADFLYYSVCQGQKEIGPIGYSSLPINLVQASFAQTAKLKQADPNVDLTKRDVTTCHNPTFVAGHPEVNRLAQIAPQPAACDRQGAGPCTGDGSAPAAGGSGSGSNGNSGSGSGSGQSRTGGNSTTGRSNHAAGGTGGHAQAGTGATAGPGANTAINPDTGQPVGASGGSADVQGVPTELAASRSPDLTGMLAPLAVVELLAVLGLPPFVYTYLVRRRRVRG